MARSAYREAVGYFEQALSALSHFPQSRETLEQAIDLQLALRSALWPLGDSERILVALREAEGLAEALNDQRRLGQVLLFLANYFNSKDEYDQAIAAGQRALALATAGGDGALHALANQRRGQAYRAQGDYRRAIDFLGQAAAFFDAARGPERLGRVTLPAVNSRCNLAWCHAELGTFAEGHVLGGEGLRIAEALAHPASLVFAANGIGMLFLRQGDLPRALLLLERAVGICRDADLPALFPGTAAALGAAYTMAGRIAEAVPLLTQVLEQATVRERVSFRAFCSLQAFCSLGEAQLLAGHLQEAHTLAEQALAQASAHQERGHQAYALRLLGEIAAQREPPERAQTEAYYRQALALAEELGMHPLQAHCHRGLGTLYTKIDQRELAQAELAAAIDLYRAMDMTFWLPQAEASLAQVT
jgi:tetratricopeptide (TPR) repeat protein